MSIVTVERGIRGRSVQQTPLALHTQGPPKISVSHSRSPASTTKPTTNSMFARCTPAHLSVRQSDTLIAFHGYPPTTRSDHPGKLQIADSPATEQGRISGANSRQLPVDLDRPACDPHQAGLEQRGTPAVGSARACHAPEPEELSARRRRPTPRFHRMPDRPSQLSPGVTGSIGGPALLQPPPQVAPPVQ